MEDDIFLQLSNLVDGTSSSGGMSAPYSSPYGAPDSTMFTHDNMQVPNVRPKKAEHDKRCIVIIDDDFSTLDLMKIYLQRDYVVQLFDNPKNAIFYLNSTVPDMIFIDCYLNVMTTKRVLDIIRSYRELANTPIIYLAEPSEKLAIENKLPEGVLDIIPRPVTRADLQKMLDTYIKEEEPEEPEDNGIIS